MRILGIDYGEKRIGVAISDPLGLTAQGVCVLEKGKTFEEDMQNLKSAVAQYEGIEEIVVGLPKTLSGEVGIAAQGVLKFVKFLQASNMSWRITTFDERLTSAQANRMFAEAGISSKKRRKIVDKTAAVLILQNYLALTRPSPCPHPIDR